MAFVFALCLPSVDHSIYYYKNSNKRQSINNIPDACSLTSDQLAITGPASTSDMVPVTRKNSFKSSGVVIKEIYEDSSISEMSASEKLVVTDVMFEVEAVIADVDEKVAIDDCSEAAKSSRYAPASKGEPSFLEKFKDVSGINLLRNIYFYIAFLLN